MFPLIVTVFKFIIISPDNKYNNIYIPRKFIII